MRLVIISDTHGKHNQLHKLEGDILIHCGDFSNGFQKNSQDLAKIDDWFGTLPFDRIFCIGGNHDFEAEERQQNQLPIFQNAIWLHDKAFSYKGIKLYGSPWLPDLMGWAFYLNDSARRQKYAQIPIDTDLLITHTPPYGILDQSSRGKHCGCPHLLERVNLVQPKLHLFGHIHASYGITKNNKTKFINASIVRGDYEVSNPPVILDFP